LSFREEEKKLLQTANDQVLETCASILGESFELIQSILPYGNISLYRQPLTTIIPAA